MSYSPAWITAYDKDFTVLALSTASADGAFAVGTDSWLVQNYASASVVSVGGTGGLRLKANAVNSTMTPPSRTGPVLASPSLETLTGRTGARYGIRVTAYVKSENLTNTNEGLALFLDTRSNNQRYEYSRYRAAASKMDFARLVLNNSIKVTQDVSIPLANHDCLQIEVPFFGADYAFLRSGIYASGWPAKFYCRASIAAASGAWLPTLHTELADAYVSLGIESRTTNAVLDVSFGRLKIEYRLG